MRPIDIIASNNNRREPKAFIIRLDQHFSRSFAGRVGVGRGKDAGLQQLILVFLNFSINLVCRDVNKSLNTCLFCTFKEHMCAVNISMRKAIGITKAQVDMRLGCEVHHSIDIIPLHTIENFRWVSEIAVIKGKVALVV